jgi:putative phosphoesterase
MQTRTSLEFIDEPHYCAFGADTLLSKSRELGTQVEGAKKNEDIEYVHKLRVASRRLRTALDIFEECLPRKLVKAWKKAIKTVTTSCGAARDADVLIAFLENYSTHQDPRAAVGIEYLVRLQKARRLLMQSEVVHVLDSLQASQTLANIADTCSKMSAGNEGKKPNIKTLSTYQNAHNHIAALLDELLALSRFVHDQKAITKHHEIRIAAKRLRYTMEIFSNIYNNGLKDQIALMKQFQDMIGEMHDYYVWGEDIRALRREMPFDAKYGTDKLLVNLRKQRASRYREFVSLWNEAKLKGLFTGIRQKIDTGSNSEIIRELLGTQNQIALISDIHGNADALKAVVKHAQKSGLQIFLNAGDTVGFGIYPSQVLQTLRSPKFLSVIGNVDLEVLEELRLSKSNKNSDSQRVDIDELPPSDIAYLQSLPKELRFEIGGRRVLVTHGSPDSVDEHIYPDSPGERLREIAAKASADIIVTGHTHLQMNRMVDGVSFVNPGSVGRPVSGEPKAEYAVLSLDPVTVEFRRVKYDVETLANQMRRKELPESQVQMLLRGLNLDTIEKQEKALARKQLWKSHSTIKKVRDTAKSYFPDESHAEQDRRLALMIFDKMKRTHSFGPRERYWLQCAAILHDIGRSRRNKGHHKLSLSLILNDPDLPFTQKERYMVGSIARYHRKALPDKEHFNIKHLSRTEREKANALASILRLADALDYSHRSVVKKVNLKTVGDQLVIECFASGQHYLEDQSVKKKKDLFEKTFKCNLAILWKPQELVGHASVSKADTLTRNPATTGISQGTPDAVTVNVSGETPETTA